MSGTLHHLISVLTTRGLVKHFVSFFFIHTNPKILFHTKFQVKSSLYTDFLLTKKISMDKKSDEKKKVLRKYVEIVIL